MRQITLNLLSNAVKFATPAAEMRVRVGWTAGGGQYISVKDNGPGIPEDEIPVVLSAFGQGSIAIKSAEQGTGLGLPIVQGLVAMHGGEFELHSQAARRHRGDRHLPAVARHGGAAGGAPRRRRPAAGARPSARRAMPELRQRRGLDDAGRKGRTDPLAMREPRSSSGCSPRRSTARGKAGLGRTRCASRQWSRAAGLTACSTAAAAMAP